MPPGVRQTSATNVRTVSERDVVDGGTYFEDPNTGQLMAEGPMLGGPMVGAPMSKGGVGCADGTCGTCSDCTLVPCGCPFPFPFGNLELFAGVQGFTGPANRSTGTGSFGFHEGLNWGIPIPGFQCLGGQIGFRATQSNLSGAEFTNDTRTQGFVTAGLFRRVDVGLQGGVVFDYLSDGWYRDADLSNMRGELSWVFDGCHELGFWFSSATNTSDEPFVEGDVVDELIEVWESTDLYAFFYRHQFGACREGDVRVFAGWSGHSDGLIGVDLRLPLGCKWALQTNIAYLIPEQGEGHGFDAGHTQESWNLGITLVWYPGQMLGHRNYYYRPLFRVADNGVFMMDRLQP
jgi:hypothetical protein